MSVCACFLILHVVTFLILHVVTCAVVPSMGPDVILHVVSRAVVPSMGPDPSCGPHFLELHREMRGPRLGPKLGDILCMWWLVSDWG